MINKQNSVIKSSFTQTKTQLYLKKLYLVLPDYMKNDIKLLTNGK